MVDVARIVLELSHLRTFVAVCEEKNLTKAAERLYMTPPSVSAHIKALEEELHIILFVRTSRGMALTEAGASLRAKAEATLHAAQDLLNHAAALQSELLGVVTIGLNASPGFLRAADLTQALHAAHAGVTLHFVASTTGKILEQLRTGALDAGFVFGPVDDPALIAHRLQTANLVVAAPAAWAETLCTGDWTALARFPWITSDSYCPFQTITDELFSRYQLHYHRAASSNDEGAKVELVAAGVGVALLEESEAKAAGQQGRLFICPLEPIACDLAFAHRVERSNDPLIQAVTAQVRQSWQQGDGLAVSAQRVHAAARATNI